MACEGNGLSDARIGEALIKEVIEEELRNVNSEDIPPLTPLAAEVKNEQEQKLVDQLAKMVSIIGDKVQHDQELKDAIDGIAHCVSGSKWDAFQKVANKVIEPGITWEKIAVLFYVAGQLAVRMVEAHLPQSVKEIMKWTVNFFRNNLLGWIREHGGWINSFADLAVASMQSVSSLSSHRWGLILIFVAGLALGSFITLRLTRRP